MTSQKILCILAACGLMSGGLAHGVTYIDTFDTDEEGWSAKQQPSKSTPANAVVAQGTVGGRDALKIDADDSDSLSSDYIFNASTASDGILTDFGTDLSDDNVATGWGFVNFITFDFWAEGDSGGDGSYYPLSLEFYFLGGSTYWTYSFSPSIDLVSGMWNTLTVNLLGVSGSGGGWTQDGSSAFQDALGSVDEIGIAMMYGGGSEQIYGIDNFTLHNPEPGTYAMLAFAMLGVGVTFRGKIREGIATLRRQ